MHRGYSTPLVVAIMAFAVVAFLFLIDTAINPDGSNTVAKATLKINKNTSAIPVVDQCTTSDDCQLNSCGCASKTYLLANPNLPQCQAYWQPGTACVCQSGKCTVDSSTITNTSTSPTAGWKTYTNSEENFSMKYPQTFNDFSLSNDNSIGFRGKTIGTATSAEGSISIFILEKKYDTTTIEGLYGSVEKDRLNPLQVGSRTGVMFLSGDAGCGAQEVLTSLDTNRTLWISFQDCEEATPHTPLYQQQDLVNDILNTFNFTN